MIIRINQISLLTLNVPVLFLLLHIHLPEVSYTRNTLGSHLQHSIISQRDSRSVNRIIFKSDDYHSYNVDKHHYHIHTCLVCKFTAAGALMSETFNGDYIEPFCTGQLNPETINKSSGSNHFFLERAPPFSFCKMINNKNKITGSITI